MFDFSCAMLAPSFPIDFSYPKIIGKLRRLGFKKVVEVSRGAVETNNQLVELILKDGKSRWITSPCPSIVRLIKTKYPQLRKFLAPIDSPMSATAKLVVKEYPELQPVFIGPCVAKKLEAKEDWPDLNIEVLTFKELQKLFDEAGIKEEERDAGEKFDIIGKETRMYAVSGGLAKSARLAEYLSGDQIYVVSGFLQAEAALKEFERNEKIRLLDILFCEGGCISGPGIINTKLPLDERRKKVINYWETLVNCSKAS